MTQGVTAGEAYRAAGVLRDRGHKGRRDWYVGEGDEGRVVTSPGGAGAPARTLAADEAVAVQLYGMERSGRREARG